MSKSKIAPLLINSDMFFRSMARRSGFRDGLYNLLQPSAGAMRGMDTFKRAHVTHMPIVPITDLTKPVHKGVTEVSVTQLHDLVAPPIPGDHVAEGHEVRLNASADKVTVGRLRRPVETEGKLARMGDPYDQKAELQPQLIHWIKRVQDEMSRIYLAGERGSYMDSDLNIPLSDHEHFAEMFPNGIRPPSWDRHFVCNAAGAVVNGDVTTLTAASVPTRETFEELRMQLDGGANAMPPVNMMDPSKFTHANGADMLGPAEVRQLVLMSPRAFRSFKAALGAQYQQLLADTSQRKMKWDHPVFFQEGIFLEGFFITIDYVPIRFMPNSIINVSQNVPSATVATQQIPTAATLGNGVVERAIILGGQALYRVTAPVSESRMWEITRRDWDYGNIDRMCLAYVHGQKMVMSQGLDGYVRSRGVACLDMTVPLA
ncbi:MAG: DUF4043 family protein [Pseudomonadota bacterium]